MMLEPTQPLGTVRLVQAGGRASVTIPFNEPRQLHRLADAEVGDTLLVVTALGPARGFLKPQEFVEFNALVSTHGVVIQPLADDVGGRARLRQDRRDAAGRPRPVECRSAGLSRRAGSGRRAARRRRPVHARSAGLGLRPRGGFPRPPDASDRRRRRRRGRAAHAGAARARALLPRARPDRRSQGRARRRGVGRARRAGRHRRWCCARSPTSCSGAAPTR